MTSSCRALLAVLVLCSALLSVTALQCYTCSGCDEGERGVPQQCNSVQNTCVKVLLGTRIEKGCSPSAVCNLAGVEKSISDIFQGLGSSITGNQREPSDAPQLIHCCDSDYCNTATTAAPAAILLVLAPLLLTALLRR